VHIAPTDHYFNKSAPVTAKLQKPLLKTRFGTFGWSPARTSQDEGFERR
jgi:hypothetical protein